MNPIGPTGARYARAKPVRSGSSSLPVGAESTRATLADLEAQVARQNLLLQALLRLLLKKGVIEEAEYREWLDHVDMLDGARDAKLRKDTSAKPCPSCNRVNKSAATRCQYCGVEFPTQFLDRDSPAE